MSLGHGLRALPNLSLRLAAALSIANTVGDSSQCTPADDAAEFKRTALAVGLKETWVHDLSQVGVTTVMDACSVFDGFLTKEPPCPARLHCLP